MSRRRVDRVVWGEGMLVCPQHLQQQDLYFENFVQARSAWPNPHGFGCSRLDVDEGAVKGGEFRLTALQAIFPGGGALDLPEGDIACRRIPNGWTRTRRGRGTWSTSWGPVPKSK